MSENVVAEICLYKFFKILFWLPQHTCVFCMSVILIADVLNITSSSEKGVGCVVSG